MIPRYVPALVGMLMILLISACARPPLSEQRTTIDPHSTLVEKRQGDHLELRYVEGTDNQGKLNYRGYVDLQNGEVTHYDMFREGKLIARFHGDGTLWKQFDDGYIITTPYHQKGESNAARRTRHFNEGLQDVDRIITVGQLIAGTIGNFPHYLGVGVSGSTLGL
jgi:hypothetical protein